VTKSIFRIEMMPAREGDCLLVTYGNERETRRILIDGGRSATWQDVRARLQAVAQDPNELELLIITMSIGITSRASWA
jgi:hypothetical protein